jgi:hypothetical protein
MSRKFVEYEVMKTGEIMRKYEDTDNYLFDLITKMVNFENLPYLLRGGEVNILKTGVEDD